MLCKHCTNECRDLSTDSEPVLIQCPTCEGHGCDKCEHGEVRLEGCPNKACSSVAMVVQMADLFDKGMPPVTGGVLDQSAWFIDAVGVLRNEEHLVRAEMQNERRS